MYHSLHTIHHDRVKVLTRKVRLTKIYHVGLKKKQGKQKLTLVRVR